MLKNKKLIQNTLWLAGLHGGNFVTPLIALPFLVRVLGAEGFGMYIFAGVIISYLGLVCDYGFNLSGTRDIAVSRDNKNNMINVFSKIYYIKIILFLFCFVIFLLLVFISESIKTNILLYVCSFSLLIGQSFFPIWFFQGIQDFRAIVILSFSSKLIFTLLIFIMVDNPDDAFIAALMNSIGSAVAMLIAFYIAIYKYEMRFVRVPFRDLWLYSKKGFYIFLAQIKISLFSTANILILGILSGPISVGYYAAAEKIMRAVAQIQAPLLTALFPKLSLDIKLNKNDSIKLLKKVIVFGVAGYVVICSGVFIYSEEIIKLAYGPNHNESADILKIIIICPLLIYLNNIFGTQILLSLGKDKIYMMVLLFTGIINLILSSYLTSKYDYIGTSVSTLISELIVVIGMFIFAKNFFTKDQFKA